MAKSIAKKLAYVAVMTALLECAKLALSLVPNVELVTLLCAIFGSVFGIWAVVASFVFVLVEFLIWGFGPWLISYAIHWPLVTMLFCLLNKTKWFNKYWASGVAVLCCIFFAVLTSLVDVGLFSGAFDDFFARFTIYFMRGIVFYVVQIVCNAVVFLALFDLLKNLLIKIQKTTFD
ncbi:MAG: hypothetical protein J6R37_02705 [Clostridia bacterium]|nr:hypothetical protein [Clostridia bacterium]